MTTTTKSSPGDGDTRLEAGVGNLSRALAQRLTRRSALTRLGQYGAALSLGAAGAALLDEKAWAAAACSCCGQCTGGSCCGSESVWCANLPGWYQNSCPSGTCGCGSWVAGTCSSSSTPYLRYADCCGACGDGSYCYCPGGAPSCCHTQTYTNGSCSNCTNTCCGTVNHVKCRRWFCSSG